MTKEETLKYTGVVLELLPNARFRVKLIKEGSASDSQSRADINSMLSCVKDSDSNNVGVVAYAAGNIIRHRIRITTGDIVEMEVSPYNSKIGRIVYRYK
ncbi:MAG: translation initiation factor IF-1 [Candidatus Liberibacter europaeus]|uniref:Translation initiation factor IF-1 n=1 Tax=Candidatus Liberibacter europaeus TaxID=744859 RepID=A0A2T4VYW3_9HYPH|nr:translation initiation factor IF-1 [Candidatus Liberibacter europaeus]PTL86967.1 MAG: translation initiation factor IF-1 [Candidatus Liberibacter europaeus]